MTRQPRFQLLLFGGALGTALLCGSPAKAEPPDVDAVASFCAYITEHGVEIDKSYLTECADETRALFATLESDERDALVSCVTNEDAVTRPHLRTCLEAALGRTLVDTQRPRWESHLRQWRAAASDAVGYPVSIEAHGTIAVAIGGRLELRVDDGWSDGADHIADAHPTDADREMDGFDVCYLAGWEAEGWAERAHTVTHSYRVAVDGSVSLEGVEPDLGDDYRACVASLWSAVTIESPPGTPTTVEDVFRYSRYDPRDP